MTKNKSTYSCTSCGSVSSKWMGQCPECLEWGTVIEESVSASKIIVPKTGSVQEIHTLADKIESTIRTKTPIEELNRVLGGGLVAGSAILIGGDPGIGKSTLLLQL
ncbi:MAG: DNA repair protein RadA, partial [Rickettsiaceae bacterium]|nr:DNA repair protein RadA [Rickettsiaceae bacterium]